MPDLLFCSRPTRPARLWCCVFGWLVPVALTGLSAGGVQAQTEVQEQNGVLIEELSKRGMSALLERLIETDPPEDPADRQRVVIGQARLRVTDLQSQLTDAVASGDAGLAAELQAESESAFAELLEAQRVLANGPELADRRERLIWKTDLAETLLGDLLRGRREAAAEFAEFGFTTAQQRAALNAAAVEALQLMTEAEELVFDAQRFYGQNAQQRQQDQANQLYYRLIEDYGQQRVPFYHAQAMHTVALLSDDSPYFAGLGGTTPTLPGQRDTPQEERRRLLQGAVERLETLLAGDPGAAEQAVRSRLGRVLIALEQPAEGLEMHLDRVIASGSPDPAGLTAWLGKATALNQLEKPTEALETLDNAARHELAQDNPLFRLLVTDVRFKTQRARAGDDQAAADDAYRVYFDMLNGPGVEKAAPGLRSLVYRRWADDLEVGQNVQGLPAPVRMAVGQVARENGQRSLYVEDAPDEAVRHLRWAIQVNQTLTPADLPDDIRASGLFNLALSKAMLQPNDVATLIEAIRGWVEVAEEYPGQPTAEQAVQYAADYATVLVQQAPEHPATQGLYAQAMDVLFSRYDETDAAGKHRLFYAFRVFQQQGQHERAAQEYARVPFGHPQYFEAQKLRLFNLQRVYEQTPPDETDPQSGRNLRDAQRRIAASAADQLSAEAQTAQRTAADESIEAVARTTRATALMTLAAIELDSDNANAALQRLDEAQAVLKTGAAYDPARQDVLNRRIVTLVAVGRYEDASAEAQRMMADFPDAAAGVIGGVLADLESRIRALRDAAVGLPASQAKPKVAEASTLAAVAATLAKLLVDWADQQGLDPATQLAYDLPYVKALRLAGRPADALQFLKERGIVERFDQDLAVLEALGETYYALGVDEQRGTGNTRYVLQDEKHAQAAIPVFDKIITGLQSPFPDSYWNAWLHRLALNVALGIDTEKVPLRIRQLAAAHPELGGPAFKPLFDQLAVDARQSP